MDDIVISTRHASPADADEIADVHDMSWRSTYRGIIPGLELERMISRRGPDWWAAAIARRSGLLVLEFDECIVGYVSYGKNRVPTIPFRGEVFELYLLPEFQGLGFGRRLFNAARRDLAAHGYGTAVVWALSDNQPALDFYARLGGLEFRRAQERFGSEFRERMAFAFE